MTSKLSSRVLALLKQATVILAKPVYVFFSHGCLEFEASHTLVLWHLVFQHQQLLWFKTNADSEYNYSQYLITQLTFEQFYFTQTQDVCQEVYWGSIATSKLLKLNESNPSNIQAFNCEYSQLLKWFHY